jgi:carbon storage regulator
MSAKVFSGKYLGACGRCGEQYKGISRIFNVRNQRQKELKMLVLSRQKDESIMIGDDVEITIVDVRGDKVRLGIIAPREVPVHRREVYEAIQRENEEKKKQQGKEDKE